MRSAIDSCASIPVRTRLCNGHVLNDVVRLPAVADNALGKSPDVECGYEAEAHHLCPDRVEVGMRESLSIDESRWQEHLRDSSPSKCLELPVDPFKISSKRQMAYGSQLAATLCAHFYGPLVPGAYVGQLGLDVPLEVPAEVQTPVRKNDLFVDAPTFKRVPAYRRVVVGRGHVGVAQ